MEKYQWIVKQKQKGLALFHKVVKRLEAVEKELMSAKADCEEEILAHEAEIAEATREIEEQKQAIDFLTKEHVSTGEAKAKINAFLT